MPVSAMFPPAYYAWLDVKTVADTLGDLAEALANFANEIRSREKDYELFSDKLDKQLIKVRRGIGPLCSVESSRVDPQ